ncbi:MAG: rhomboid family intramembrane serine protease [Lachnospiraceae bacterium]|nr:rhomboid family intramembrane serine protease [Lachnospiraceae bacterium]MBP5668813.1 rhomboid family intramembrane serine protease [Lachnospiraceae bacterium]
MKKKHKYIITLNAVVVLGFVCLCFIATLLGELSKGKLTELLFMTYHSSLLSPLTYLRFFTHVLGHSGWQHFMGNASYLLILGPMLEEKHGSKTILEIVLITALITGIVNYIFFPRMGLCGASGVVFAFIILASFTGFNEGEIPLTFILVAILYIGEQIIQGLTVQDNISNMAHIVGGAVGAFTGFMLNRKSKKAY